MTLEIFGQEMKDRIQKKMGNGYEIDLDWSWENNGRKNGKVTIRKAGTNICPAARLDRHFEMLKKSVSEMDLEKAVEEIIRECSRPIPMKQSVTEMGLRITDYEFCKDRLFFKLVNTGEMMALFAADNISHAIQNFGKRGYAKLAGYIQNSRNVENESELVLKGARENGTDVIHIVPRDKTMQLAENQGKTVIEAYPESEMAECYRVLAKKVLEVTGT